MSPVGRKALFLDRDGVINVDSGYVHRADQFHFCDGIFELVRIARERGYAVVVVTNQAGIGRGYYSASDFLELTRWMLERFVQEGAMIDRVYHCPDHPEHGVGEYRRESSMRKPNPGMLLKAAEDLGLSLANSIMLGDKESDITAGIRAGVGCNILIDTSSAKGAPSSATSSADRVVTSLSEVLLSLK